MLKTIKDNLKYLFLKLIALKNSGGSGPNGPGVRILIFHNVKKDLWPRFRSLVEHINEKYGFLTPAEAKDYFSGKSKVAGVKFLLSFDDGFMADAELFKEVLEPAGLKALFFVCPGFVGLDGKDATDFVVNNLFAGRI